MSADLPHVVRVTLEVADLDAATVFYATLLGTPGQRHPGARHFFRCGAVVLAVLDPSAGGHPPTPNAKSLTFEVRALEPVHARAASLGALAPYEVHGEPGGAIVERPWGERSFYVVDRWGNDLCFIETGTLYA